MKKFYTLFGLFIVFGIFMFVTSCNESTVEPDLYGSISGTVKASADSSPLEGVTITTSPGTNSVVTDIEGHFDLGQVLVGDYSVTAAKEDFSSKNISISIREGQDLIMDIVLDIAPAETVAPNEPTYVSPLNGTEEVSTEVELVWNNGETEKGDTLFYEVILFKNGEAKGDTLVRDLMDTTFLAKNLNFETNYSWKVNVSNRARFETEGKKWDFKTEDFPLNSYFFVKDTLGSRDIYSWDLQENHLVRLTSEGGDELNPIVSPNLKEVAYSSNEVDGKFHIFTMDKNGRNKKQLTKELPIEGHFNYGVGFAWSPDGAKLLYSNKGDLLTINNDGAGEGVKIADAPVNRHFKDLDWTSTFNNKPYQEKIVALTQGEMSYDNEIYLMNPDGSGQVLLVDNLEGTLSNPQFSPDGSKVIFSLDSLYENGNGRQLNAKIYSINVDGTGITDLSGDNKIAGTNDLQARFSGTGGKIIFTNVLNNGEGKKTIWTMDLDGSNREQLIFNGEMPELENLVY